MHFASDGPVEALSTLVHEMVHLWQAHFGKPSRGRYHNKEWARKMDDVGLPPSDTGLPGGKRTGQRMSNYIRKDGPFARATAQLEAMGFFISWGDAGRLRTHASGGSDDLDGQAGTRCKYFCPSCHAAAWGKPGLNLICGDCHQLLLPVGTAP